MVDRRFREVNDYAWAHRFLSGFPNFHEANHGQGVVYGTFLLGSDAAEWRDVRAAELGNPPLNDVGARFRATNDWAARNGYLSGFPNFHHADYGQGRVYGTILIKRGAAEWRDIRAADLGNPPAADVPARFRATNDWAGRNGFAAGFPNFHQANQGGSTVYGTILFRPGRVQWRDLFADVLGIFSRFTFDAAITAEQRRRLLERHSFALSRRPGCGQLSAQERTALLGAYRRSIRHSVTNQAGVNASAVVGGSQIWVNFGVLFPQGDNEIAQTLIHEMTHCAGYTHPTRRDPPSPNPDIPGDNGPYYGTPPLRAEFCIAGQQSIFGGFPRGCVENNGRFDVLSETSDSISDVTEEPRDAESPQELAAEALRDEAEASQAAKLSELEARIHALEQTRQTESGQ